jgi:RNA polymerase sigma factor (sigma-70 family)
VTPEADARAAAAAAAAQAVEAIFRIESARLVAALARLVRDVPLAEDLAQDALVRALEVWPRDGVPGNPGAWLMTTAKHQALDRLRRNATLARKEDVLARETGAAFALSAAELAVAREQDLGDDVLTLLLTCCHPALGPEAQVALVLRAVGGLTTEEIARAYLVPVATIQQRIVRAKRSLRAAGAGFEVPARGEALRARVTSALAVLYLIFNEGYTATAGTDLVRPELCREAQRLARVFVTLVPEDPEAHGLLALLELQASRLGARTDAEGRPVLLADQDRARWDRLLITRGLAALARAQALAGDDRGPYLLQAAIAACHARAADAETTDWAQIAALYAALAQRAPSPVVELNRAVALGMALHPAAGLAVVQALEGDGTLARYHLLASVRGDLLEKLGRPAEAREAFLHAATLTQNERERELLQDRARRCAGG